jgi:peptide/nickel transport system permease protein
VASPGSFGQIPVSPSQRSSLGQPPAADDEMISKEHAAPAERAVRSPGRRAWKMLKHDRVAIASAGTLTVLFVAAIFADVIAAWYGHDKDTAYPYLLDDYGYPLGRTGGISSEHWLGIEPGIGRDVFLQLLYGARTSFGIAIVAAILITVIGVLFGIVAGYFGGWVDAVIRGFIDLMLTMPFVLFAIAAVPIVNVAVTGTPQLSPGPAFRVAMVVVVLAVFGWMSLARIVRGQVFSLRERDFVHAARLSSAGAWYVIFRELLPNLWSPIVVSFSMLIPVLIQTEAVLSFLNIGVVEPVPSWGRMIFYSIPYARSVWTIALFPALALFVTVLAANLLGDSVRDALDPRVTR